MIRTTLAQRKALAQLIHPPLNLCNEKPWTYLVADIVDTSPDQPALIHILAGREFETKTRLNMWIEAQPLAPRKGIRKVNSESNTIVDLAFGALRERPLTESGIEFDPHVSDKWVCFVEAKGIRRDSDFMTTHDPIRNQLERVIESLLCFHGDGQRPSKLSFTLLTARRFKEHPRSRHYGFRMNEYMSDARILRKDIERCLIPYRNSSGIGLPNLEERINLLSLTWASYEDIIEKSLGCEAIDILAPSQIPGLPDLFQQAASRLNTHAC